MTIQQQDFLFKTTRELQEEKKSRNEKLERKINIIPSLALDNIDLASDFKETNPKIKKMNYLVNLEHLIEALMVDCTNIRYPADCINGKQAKMDWNRGDLVPLKDTTCYPIDHEPRPENQFDYLSSQLSPILFSFLFMHYHQAFSLYKPVVGLIDFHSSRAYAFAQRNATHNAIMPQSLLIKNRNEVAVYSSQYLCLGYCEFNEESYTDKTLLKIESSVNIKYTQDNGQICISNPICFATPIANDWYTVLRKARKAAISEGMGSTYTEHTINKDLFKSRYIAIKEKKQQEFKIDFYPIYRDLYRDYKEFRNVIKQQYYQEYLECQTEISAYPSSSRFIDWNKIKLLKSKYQKELANSIPKQYSNPESPYIDDISLKTCALNSVTPDSETDILAQETQTLPQDVLFKTTSQLQKKRNLLKQHYYELNSVTFSPPTTKEIFIDNFEAIHDAALLSAFPLNGFEHFNDQQYSGGAARQDWNRDITILQNFTKPLPKRQTRTINIDKKTSHIIVRQDEDNFSSPKNPTLTYSKDSSKLHTKFEYISAQLHIILFGFLVNYYNQHHILFKPGAVDIYIVPEKKSSSVNINSEANIILIKNKTEISLYHRISVSLKPPSYYTHEEPLRLYTYEQGVDIKYSEKTGDIILENITTKVEPLATSQDLKTLIQETGLHRLKKRNIIPESNYDFFTKAFQQIIYNKPIARKMKINFLKQFRGLYANHGELRTIINKSTYHKNYLKFLKEISVYSTKSRYVDWDAIKQKQQSYEQEFADFDFSQQQFMESPDTLGSTPLQTNTLDSDTSDLETDTLTQETDILQPHMSNFQLDPTGYHVRYFLPEYYLLYIPSGIDLYNYLRNGTLPRDERKYNQLQHQINKFFKLIFGLTKQLPPIIGTSNTEEYTNALANIIDLQISNHQIPLFYLQPLSFVLATMECIWDPKNSVLYNLLRVAIDKICQRRLGQDYHLGVATIDSIKHIYTPKYQKLLQVYCNKKQKDLNTVSRELCVNLLFYCITKLELIDFNILKDHIIKIESRKKIDRAKSEIYQDRFVNLTNTVYVSEIEHEHLQNLYFRMHHLILLDHLLCINIYSNQLNGHTGNKLRHYIHRIFSNYARSKIISEQYTKTIMHTEDIIVNDVTNILYDISNFVPSVFLLRILLWSGDMPQEATYKQKDVASLLINSQLRILDLIDKYMRTDDFNKKIKELEIQLNKDNKSEKPTKFDDHDKRLDIYESCFDHFSNYECLKLFMKLVALYIIYKMQNETTINDQIWESGIGILTEKIIALNDNKIITNENIATILDNAKGTDDPVELCGLYHMYLFFTSTEVQNKYYGDIGFHFQNESFYKNTYKEQQQSLVTFVNVQDIPEAQKNLLTIPMLYD